MAENHLDIVYGYKGTERKAFPYFSESVFSLVTLQNFNMLKL